MQKQVLVDTNMNNIYGLQNKRHIQYKQYGDNIKKIQIKLKPQEPGTLPCSNQ